MGNIDINKIRKRGFDEISKMARVEEYCRQMASSHTDGLIDLYNKLEESRNGRYINSDLMKMVFPFYAQSFENRRTYNLCITNSAAVLTNEAFERAIKRKEVERCIFVIGPYGAGKSVFSQSLFDREEEACLEKSIIYEGSITPPAFDEKIEYAKRHDVTPELIALNPTLELSMRNIKKRAEIVGRDVTKEEVVDKFSSFYGQIRGIVEKFKGIPYIIYSKSSNIPVDLSSGSKNIEEFNYGTKQEISEEYDRIKRMLELENLER